MNDLVLTSAQDVADRVAAFIRRALETPQIGRGEAGANRALASQLHLLARQIERTWAPDLDLRRALATLGQTRLRATAQQQAAPFMPDVTLGFAPAKHGAIVAAAAAELTARPGMLDAALSEARRARTSSQLANTAITLELDARSLADRLQASPLQERRIAELRREAAEKDRHATAAFETCWARIHDSLRAFPPLSVALSADGLAALLRTEVDAAEWFLDRRLGGPRYAALGAARSLVLDGLAALRREVVRAFPGAARGPRAQRGSDSVSPYRTREATDDVRPEALESELDRMSPCLENDAVRAVKSDTLGRATVLALLEQVEAAAGPPIGALEGVLGGPSFDDADIAARIAALRHVLERSAHDLVTRLAMSHALAWPYRLEHGVLVVHQAFQDLKPNGIRARRDSNQEPIIGLSRASFAVEEMRRVLRAIFGITLDRPALVLAVAFAIETNVPTPPPLVSPDRFLTEAEVTRLLAEALRPTSFLGVYRRIQSARREAAALEAEVAEAELAVSLFDKINILTTSETEARRNALRERLAVLVADGERAASRAGSEVERALGAYPPAELVLRFADVAEALDALQLVYQQADDGIIAHHEAALRALRLWSLRAGAVIRVPPAGTLLEEHAARGLGDG